MVEIYYCVPWNYLPKAVSLAAKIKDTCGLDAKLFPGARGEFTVKYNGEIIAKKDGFFPPVPEILKTLSNKMCW